MIRYGNQLRLNRQDLERLYKLTGSNPNTVRTVAELNSFVDRHLPLYDDLTPESQLLRMLLQDEKIRT